jgi:hypothetical protein
MFDQTPTSRVHIDKPESVQLVANVVDFLQELFVVDPARTQKTILEQLALLWGLMKEHAPTAIATAAASVAVLALALLLRLRRKAVAVVAMKPRNITVDAYLQVLAALRQLGFILETGDTARRVFATAGQHFPPLETPLQSLLPLYERSAFAPVEPDAPEHEQAAALAAEVRDFAANVVEERRKAKRRR